ncbi:MAG: DNA polymerase III subunit alpha [Proteobacteria bacterium]|nr:DNA polymerase III subunit alpha [Pseudomonadota bacterium]
MTPRFVHLHVHSEYSLRDSTARLPDKPEYGDPHKAARANLVGRAVQLQLPALALTDLSNVFGLVKFYRAAEKMGIKPIAGADVFLAQGNEVSRLTLLCTDRSGYLGLSRLISRAYLEGHHGDFVAIAPEWLHREARGLIVLAGRQSHVGKLAGDGHLDTAEHALSELQRHFDHRLYLELTRTGREREQAFNAAALELAARRDLPLVASNDVRFLDRDDFEAHEARVCIAGGWVLNDPRRPRDYSPEQYLKTEDEMCELFADLPEALENSVELARRCNIELEFGKNYLPAFPVPSDQTVESWLRAQAHDGLRERLARHPPADDKTVADYRQRLDLELDVIVRMDFPGYFLIVADFINWAKRNDIPVGPGRGSGAGSLVAYSLGITDLDPLRYELLFERFLNPERVSMPDFDIDFCMERRDEVIEYVAGKYGHDRVSQIITYGTMAAKAVLRDAGRVLGMPHGQIDRIAKLIPLRPADPLSLDDALGRSEKARKDPERIVPELKQAYEDDEDVRALVDLAHKLEDLVRNAGKHAGGVVIAPSPLTDFAALFAEEGARGAVTQFDKDDIEAVGLVKFDFLGLRTLTIIDWAVKAVNAGSREQGAASREQRAASKESGLGTRDSTSRDSGLDKPGLGKAVSSEAVSSEAVSGRAVSGSAEGGKTQCGNSTTGISEPRLDIAAIPLDDPEVFKLFREARTGAVFQFEGRGMQQLLREARPDRFGDLVALNALFRPGPMDLIPSFCARKHGKEPIEYPDARVEPVLRETYGIMVYQEQVMQMAQIVGGYSLGGADLLRRAMGKKIAAEMARHRAIFREGAAQNGLDERRADAIFDQMEKFAGYGFNKSHAAAYSLVAYQTAWLKVHYPAQFMAATLSADMDSTDKLVGLLQDVRATGLTILPPHVNQSPFHFQPLPGKQIRYGLGAIKGVGQGACEAIVQARESGGPFRDLLDFCMRVSAAGMNRRTLEALINAGAMDGLASNRASLLLQLPEAIKAAEQQARERAAGQVSLFGDPALATAADSARIALPETHAAPLEQTLANEYAALGHYLSGHPLDPYRAELASLTDGATLRDLERLWQAGRDRRGEAKVLLAGMVGLLRKRGADQAFVQFEDGYGQIEVAFFREAFSEYAALLGRGRILLIEGGLREDEFSGGFSLRAARVWDFAHLCAQQARRLSLTADLREPGTLERLEQTLAAHRPGGTPLRLRLRLPNVIGSIEMIGTQSVRVEPPLLGKLRALPGVSEVAVLLHKPS